jgi:hypothetical protein
MIEGPAGDCAEQPEQLETQVTISRRRLLQVLGGAGGAVAAWSLLPGKWTRPVVEASVLTRKAQASPIRSTLHISDLATRTFDRDRAVDGDAFFDCFFRYTDDLSQVSDSGTLAADLSPCGQIFFQTSLTALEAHDGLIRNGSSHTGIISFPFNASLECLNGGATLCVTLDVTGRSTTACTGISALQ